MSQGRQARRGRRTGRQKSPEQLANEAYRAFRRFYERCDKSGANEVVLWTADGKEQFVNVANLWEMTKGCNGKQLHERAPRGGSVSTADKRHIFFHMCLRAKDDARRANLRDPTYVNSLVSTLFYALKAQLPTGTNFSFAWSSKLDDDDFLVCNRAGDCCCAFNNGRDYSLLVPTKKCDPAIKQCNQCLHEFYLEPYCWGCECFAEDCKMDSGSCHKFNRYGLPAGEGIERVQEVTLTINVRVSNPCITQETHEILCSEIADTMNSNIDHWDFKQTLRTDVGKDQVPQYRVPILGPNAVVVDKNFKTIEGAAVPRILCAPEETVVDLGICPDEHKKYETSVFRSELLKKDSLLRKGLFRPFDKDFETVVLNKLPIELRRGAVVELAWTEARSVPGFRAYIAKRGSSCCPTGCCSGQGRFVLEACGAVWAARCLRCKESLAIVGGGINANILRDKLWEVALEKSESDQFEYEVRDLKCQELGDFTDSYYRYRHEVASERVRKFCDDLRQKRYKSKRPRRNNATK